jgi:predicted dehydrogenase
VTKIVNVAVVGGGLMGREIAAALQRWPALVNHPVHPQLTGVCDINPAALDWFDQIPTVTRTVTDYVELLADDAIDVLYIAVRHDLHRQLYVDTIQAGMSAAGGRHFVGCARGLNCEHVERRFVSQWPVVYLTCWTELTAPQ